MLVFQPAIPKFTIAKRIGFQVHQKKTTFEVEQRNSSKKNGTISQENFKRFFLRAPFSNEKNELKAWKTTHTCIQSYRNISFFICKFLGVPVILLGHFSSTTTTRWIPRHSNGTRLVCHRGLTLSLKTTEEVGGGNSMLLILLMVQKSQGQPTQHALESFLQIMGIFFTNINWCRISEPLTVGT